MQDNQDNALTNTNENKNRFELMRVQMKKDVFEDIKPTILNSLRVVGMKYDDNTIVIVPIHRVIKREMKKVVNGYPSIGRAILAQISMKEIKEYVIELLNEKYEINAKIKPMSGLVFVRQKTLEKQKKNQGKPTTKSHNSSRVSIVVSMEDSKKITDLVMVDRVEDWKI